MCHSRTVISKIKIAETCKIFIIFLLLFIFYWVLFPKVLQSFFQQILLRGILYLEISFWDSFLLLTLKTDFWGIYWLIIWWIVIKKNLTNANLYLVIIYEISRMKKKFYSYISISFQYVKHSCFFALRNTSYQIYVDKNKCVLM